MQSPGVIPVLIFAYARPGHLARTLASLRENQVPLIYAFADGAKGPQDADAVLATRRLLREVTWCEINLVERDANYGLGRNVRSGIDEVYERHEAFIVWEDDLIAVPGTYDWLCAALRHYREDERVMSITAWTHPRVLPDNIGGQPYFDGRAECWVWGSWPRAWRGMEQTALEKIAVYKAGGGLADAYGADLPGMARVEQRKNLWAVRWLYHHLLSRGLCLRPASSMVEHIGFGQDATHAGAATDWANPPLRPAPELPDAWPQSVENPLCRGLWQKANPRQSRFSLVQRAFRRQWRRLRLQSPG